MILLYTTVCTLWFGRGVPSSKCELEQNEYCKLGADEQTCYFTDRFDEDMDVPLKDVLDGFLNRRDANKGCRLPEPGDRPFVVKIEPCFNNGTTSESSERDHCDDPTIDFYTQHLMRVSGINKKNSREGSTDKAHRNTPHIVSGIPSEIKIIKMGRAFVLGNTGDSRTGENPQLKGELLSKFRFRTYPFHSMAYDKYLSSAKTSFQSFMGNPVFRKSADGESSSEPLTDEKINDEKIEKMQENYHPSTAPEGWSEIEWDTHGDDDTTHRHTSYIPKPGFICPMQVTFDDIRTPDMSANQQMENVYPVNIGMVTELPNALIQHGMGCFMCISPREDTLKETLLKEANWNRHYHPHCTIKDGAQVPFLRSTDMLGKGDVNFKPEMLNMDTVAGVYTLYPYVEQPAPSANDEKPTDARDEFHFQKLSETINTYMDPAYTITIEIVGMRKNKGSRVIRNFHGRILEKGLVNPEYRFFKHPGTPVYHTAKHTKDYFKKINNAPFDFWNDDDGNFITDPHRREERSRTHADFFQKLDAFSRQIPAFKRDQWAHLFDYSTHNDIDYKEMFGHPSSQLCNIRRRSVCINGRVTPMKMVQEMFLKNGETRPWSNDIKIQDIDVGGYTGRDYLPIELSAAILNPLCLMAYQSCRGIPIEDDDQMFVMTVWDYLRWSDFVTEYYLRTTFVWDGNKNQKTFYGTHYGDLEEFDDPSQFMRFYRVEATDQGNTMHTDQGDFDSNTMHTCYLSKFDLHVIIEYDYLRHRDQSIQGHPCSICDDFEEILHMLDFSFNNKLLDSVSKKKIQEIIQAELNRRKTSGTDFLSVHCIHFDHVFPFKIPWLAVFGPLYGETEQLPLAQRRMRIDSGTLIPTKSYEEQIPAWEPSFMNFPWSGVAGPFDEKHDDASLHYNSFDWPDYSRDDHLSLNHARYERLPYTARKFLGKNPSKQLEKMGQDFKNIQVDKHLPIISLHFKGAIDRLVSDKDMSAEEEELYRQLLPDILERSGKKRAYYFQKKQDRDPATLMEVDPMVEFSAEYPYYREEGSLFTAEKFADLYLKFCETRTCQTRSGDPNREQLVLQIRFLGTILGKNPITYVKNKMTKEEYTDFTAVLSENVKMQYGGDPVVLSNKGKVVPDMAIMERYFGTQFPYYYKKDDCTASRGTIYSLYGLACDFVTAHTRDDNFFVRSKRYYVASLLTTNRLKALHMYLVQQLVSWEPTEKKTCIVGQIFEKELDVSTKTLCKSDVDDIPAPKVGSRLKKRNISVTFDNMYPLQEDQSGSHYIASAQDKDGCNLKEVLMSGLMFDTHMQKQQETSSNNKCPRVQHHQLWDLAVFFGDSKMIWGKAAREYLSPVAEVPGLGCTIQPGLVRWTSVWGKQCHSIFYYIPKKVETKTASIEFTTCYPDDLVTWWKQLFESRCLYKNEGFNYHAPCVYGSRVTCDEHGNSDGCGSKEQRGMDYSWFNWDTSVPSVNERAQKNGVTNEFLDYYKKNYQYGQYLSDIFRGKVDAEWKYKGDWAHTRTINWKKPLDFPWICNACDYYDFVSSEMIGFLPTYGGVCFSSEGRWGQMQWMGFGPSQPSEGIETSLPNFEVIRPKSECAYEHTIRGYFVDHAQCPNTDSLLHFLVTEQYSDYYSCNCYIVKKTHNTNPDGEKTCCTFEEADQLQNGIPPWTQSLFEKNSDDVDGIHIWSFTSDEFNYVGTDTMTAQEKREFKHHCPVGQDTGMRHKDEKKFMQFSDAVSKIYNKKAIGNLYTTIPACSRYYSNPYVDRHGEHRCCALPVFTSPTTGIQICTGDFNNGLVGVEHRRCPRGYLHSFTRASFRVTLQQDDILQNHTIITIMAKNDVIKRYDHGEVTEEYEAPIFNETFDNISLGIQKSNLIISNLKEVQQFIVDKIGIPQYFGEKEKTFWNLSPGYQLFTTLYPFRDDYSCKGSVHPKYGYEDYKIEYIYTKGLGCNIIEGLNHEGLYEFMNQFGAPDYSDKNYHSSELVSPYSLNILAEEKSCYIFISTLIDSDRTRACLLGMSNIEIRPTNSTQVIEILNTPKASCRESVLKINSECINDFNEGDSYHKFVYYSWTDKIPTLGKQIGHNGLNPCRIVHPGSDIPIAYSQRCGTGKEPCISYAEMSQYGKCTISSEKPYAQSETDNFVKCHINITSTEECSKISKHIINNIANEANIMGMDVNSPILNNIPSDQFPNGLTITTPSPKIHTRISRSLGPGSVLNRGCNVVLAHTPNITFTKIELDNTDCQEEALLQLGNTNPGEVSTESTFRRAFLKLKGWDMSPVHITNRVPGIEPQNISFSDVRLSAATNFRKMFPGRPLISIDNVGSGSKLPVDVDGLWLSNINDTHRYRDNRDFIDNPFPLAPLHMVMWHYKGNITYHDVERSPLNVVSFAESSIETHNYLDPVDDTNKTTEYEHCIGSSNLVAWLTFGVSVGGPDSNFRDREDPSLAERNFGLASTRTMILKENLFIGWNRTNSERIGGYNENYEYVEQSDADTSQNTLVEPIRLLALRKYSSGYDGTDLQEEDVLEQFVSSHAAGDLIYKKLEVLPNIDWETTEKIEPTRTVRHFDDFIKKLEQDSTFFACPSECKKLGRHNYFMANSALMPEEGHLGENSQLSHLRNILTEDRRVMDEPEIKKMLRTSQTVSQNVVESQSHSGRNVIVFNISCVKDPYRKKKRKNRLLILDGNDFFDIAYDRFRCFDTPATNCNSSQILEIVSTIFFFILAYIFFKAVVYTVAEDEKQKCVSIIESVEDEVKDVSK